MLLPPTCRPHRPPSRAPDPQAVPMLFLWETKRRDRLEVFAHHVATIVLIAYSYYLKCAVVGVEGVVCGAGGGDACACVGVEGGSQVGAVL